MWGPFLSVVCRDYKRNQPRNRSHYLFSSAWVTHQIDRRRGSIRVDSRVYWGPPWQKIQMCSVDSKKSIKRYNIYRDFSVQLMVYMGNLPQKKSAQSRNETTMYTDSYHPGIPFSVEGSGEKEVTTYWIIHCKH